MIRGVRVSHPGVGKPQMGDDHFKLVDKGLEFHEARAYAEALPYFERACAAAPGCPTARYNRANTLHMLNRDRRAASVLRPILAASAEELREGCPDCRPRGLKLDALFLMSQILRSSREPREAEEAVAFAAMHLRQRRRGVHSVWTARQVRAELVEMRRELPPGPTARRAAARDGDRTIAKRRRDR